MGKVEGIFPAGLRCILGYKMSRMQIHMAVFGYFSREVILVVRISTCLVVAIGLYTLQAKCRRYGEFP